MNRTEKSKLSEELLRAVTDYTKHIKKAFLSFWTRLKKRVYNSPVLRKLMQRENLYTLISTVKCISLAVVSYMFGRCDFGFGTYPLGIALLICSGKLSFFAYAGSAAAALTYPENGFAFFGINTLIYIIRKLLLSDDFCESRKARVLTGIGASIFIFSAFYIGSFSAGDFHIESDVLVRCASYAALLPLIVYFLYPITSKESFGSASAKWALALFCIFTVMSPAFTFPHGFNLSLCLACVFSLFFSALFDTGFAVCVSALFGLATLNFVFATPLSTAAFVFSKLYNRKHFAAYPSFLLVCTALCILTSDISLYGTVIFLDIAIGTLLFIPAGIFIHTKSKQSDATPPAHEVVSEAYNRRMASLSGAFNSVSKLCFNFSSRLRFPTPEETSVLISVSAAKICAGCPHIHSCKNTRYFSDPELSEHLLSGRLTLGKLPDKLKSACGKSERIIQEINDEYKKLLTERFNNNKTEILAYEYSTIARILKYTSRLSSEDICYDGILTRNAHTAVRKMGLVNTGVTAYGSRRKTLDISGVPVSSINKPSENIATYFSAECGVLFDLPEFILDEDSTFTMRFRSKELIAVEYVKASHTKTGETVSGDTISFFESSDSFFYALIADGMGSGRDAAMTSRITSVFVEKLLSGGAGKGVTMELLNNLLMSKSKECFSSVDLLEVDLLRKRASFVKAGAAPAYLLRSAKLFKVSSDTPPCGIVEGFSAENTSFEVMSGDIIIMLSDGITSSIDCGNALCSIMNENRSSPCEAIASKILDYAVSLAVHDDDMSCVIVKIK